MDLMNVEGHMQGCTTTSSSGSSSSSSSGGGSGFVSKYDVLQSPAAVLLALSHFGSTVCCTTRGCCFNDSVASIVMVRKMLPHTERQRTEELVNILRAMYRDKKKFHLTHPLHTEIPVCQTWFLFLFGICRRKLTNAKNMVAKNLEYSSDMDLRIEEEADAIELQEQHDRELYHHSGRTKAALSGAAASEAETWLEMLEGFASAGSRNYPEVQPRVCRKNHKAYVYAGVADNISQLYNAFRSSRESTAEAEGVEDAERAPTISYQAFSQLHASKFPHLLPGSKRICPVCEDFKIHQGSHSSAEEYTAIWKAQMHHMKAVYQERMFESELRNEARRSFEKIVIYLSIDYLSRCGIPFFAHGVHPAHAIPLCIGGVESIVGSSLSRMYGVHVHTETSNTVLSLLYMHIHKFLVADGNRIAKLNVHLDGHSTNKSNATICFFDWLVRFACVFDEVLLHFSIAYHGENDLDTEHGHVKSALFNNRSDLLTLEAFQHTISAPAVHRTCEIDFPLYNFVDWFKCAGFTAVPLKGLHLFHFERQGVRVKMASNGEYLENVVYTPLRSHPTGVPSILETDRPYITSTLHDRILSAATPQSALTNWLLNGTQTPAQLQEFQPLTPSQAPAPTPTTTTAAATPLPMEVEVDVETRPEYVVTNISSCRFSHDNNDAIELHATFQGGGKEWISWDDAHDGTVITAAVLQFLDRHASSKANSITKLRHLVNELQRQQQQLDERAQGDNEPAQHG